MQLSRRGSVGGYRYLRGVSGYLPFFCRTLLWFLRCRSEIRVRSFVSDLRLLPRNADAGKYHRCAWHHPLFPIYLWNGLKLAVAGAFGAMLFATPAAYALSRFRFRNRNLMMIGLLAFQMISPLVIMVPLYRYMDRVGIDRQPASGRRSSISRSRRRCSPGC